MTDVRDLLASVTSRYAVQQLPAWPAPWPDREPDDDAYSRLTHPERFEILFRRADAWIDELATLPGITVEPLDEPGRSATHGRAFTRGRRVVCDRSGAAPLLVLEEDEPVPGITLALTEPQVILEQQPMCECDACDDGSDRLLNAVDQVFVDLVSGPVVVLHGAGPRWEALWSRERRQGSLPADSGLDFHELMRRCARIAAGDEIELPPGTKVWTSQPWLDEAPGQGVVPAT